MPDKRESVLISGQAAGLYLLFEHGRRPDFAAIGAAQASTSRGHISFIPGRPAAGGINWLELLLDGLTFDLLGFKPGPGLGIPCSAPAFGQAEEADSPGLEACGLFAGPHIAAASHTLPVVRAQMVLARNLVAELPDIAQVIWSPAGNAMHPDMFARAIDAWIAGGGFPALALVAFRRDDTEALSSHGLAFFTGQELKLDQTLCLDPVAATRLAARLVHELVGSESVAEPREFIGPDGQQLRMIPIAGGSILKVEQS